MRRVAALDLSDIDIATQQIDKTVAVTKGNANECLSSRVPIAAPQYRNAVASGQAAHATLSETLIRIDPTLPRCGTDCVQQRFLTFEAKLWTSRH